MREINASELSKILKEHERWCCTNEKEGEKADLSHVNLSRANLSRANLHFANLSDSALFESKKDYPKATSYIYKQQFCSHSDINTIHISSVVGW